MKDGLESLGENQPDSPQPPGKKRLIILCDGTWQDSLGDREQPPSNVTRFSRALHQYAEVEDPDGKRQSIPQIVYYQKGIGTGYGDKIRGGAVGLGLDANIRSAYGFIANNYLPGDKIFFFGFSRGAFTARAVASLILSMGLLTSKGMDKFYTIYNDFFNNHRTGDYYDSNRRQELGLHYLEKYTIEIIGVWDTVGFVHTGEAFIIQNHILQPDVKYGFHALALDERRNAYKPYLWYQQRNGVEGQELLQVWFSGDHLDVGGGKTDSRLSDITLAWMIYQSSKNKQLSFNIEGYLLNPNIGASDVWASSEGPTKRDWNITHLWSNSTRRPCAYSARGPTNEELHESIRDRRRRGRDGRPRQWPCNSIHRLRVGGSYVYEALPGRQQMDVSVAEGLELSLRGRIRPYHA